VEESYEHGRADDRPDDREGLAAHPEHERLGEVELKGNPRSEESADETERNGREKPSAGSSSDRLPDRAADGRDYQQHDETRQCDRHD